MVDTVEPVSSKVLTVLPYSTTSVSVGRPKSPGGIVWFLVVGPDVEQLKPSDGPPP